MLHQRTAGHGAVRHLDGQPAPRAPPARSSVPRQSKHRRSEPPQHGQHDGARFTAAADKEKSRGEEEEQQCDRSRVGEVREHGDEVIHCNRDRRTPWQPGSRTLEQTHSITTSQAITISHRFNCIAWPSSVGKNKHQIIILLNSTVYNLSGWYISHVQKLRPDRFV